MDGAAESQWALDSFTTGPAIVGNNRSDLLAANHLGRALYADVYNDPSAPPNFARFTFLDSAAHRFYPDWDLAADITVVGDQPLHRSGVGPAQEEPQRPGRRALHSQRRVPSPLGRPQCPRTHGTGTKHFHHHIVGDLTLAYESLDLRAEPGLTMTIYAAEPDSPTAHALALLASWAASQELTPVRADKCSPWAVLTGTCAIWLRAMTPSLESPAWRVSLGGG